MVTRAELSAARAAGVVAEPKGTLSGLKAQREAGLTPADAEAVRQERVEIAAMEAFGAATLTEAQAIIGGAVPGVVTSISLGSNWDSPSGATPQTTTTETLDVPVGNPGHILITRVRTAGAGVAEYSLNGAAFVAITGFTTPLSVADTDTLALRVTGAGTVVEFAGLDATTGATFGTSTVTTA